MRIDPKTTIAGQPAVRVRDFLRRHTGSWGLPRLREQLKIDEVAARRLVKALLKRRLIQKDSRWKDEGPYWRMTLAGSTFSLATAAKPVRREIAEAAVAAFLQRVREVNSDPRFLYRVVEVEAFGSYLTDAKQLGDVDLAVKLESKEPDAKRREATEENHIHQARTGGRRFQNVVDKIFWPQLEVRLYLKARSRVLSIHEPDDPSALGAMSRVIFPTP